MQWGFFITFGHLNQIKSLQYVCVVLHLDVECDLLQRNTEATRTPNTSSTRTPAHTTVALTEIQRERRNVIIKFAAAC